MALVGMWFFVGSVGLRLGVYPAVWLFPRLRYRITSRFFKIMSGGIFALLGVGGARFRRRGTIPTDAPVVIIANHQSLVDILQASLMAQPVVPAYVSRARYARFVPLVAPTLRLLRCPLVDPKRDPTGAVEVIRRGARELQHGLLIFPEGHRTRDGEVGPFRRRGAVALLAERRVPVYLMVNDGAWRVAKFVHLLHSVHLIDYESEILGPFEIPEDPEQVPAFLEWTRETIVKRLQERRRAA
jgi:1-acyl-sn-glycerol-3-phosphate acyltransferase